jgi:hypothetical protein
MPDNMRLLNRTISVSSTIPVDEEALKKVGQVVLKVSQDWPGDTIEILSQRNLGLLETLGRTESKVESMLFLLNKPTAIKREFTKILAEYEKLGSMCAMYAKRHTKK